MQPDYPFGSKRHCASSLRRVAIALWVFPILLGGLFNAHEIRALERINPKGHSGDVLAVAFTSDGKTLVNCRRRRTCQNLGRRGKEQVRADPDRARARGPQAWRYRPTGRSGRNRRRGHENPPLGRL